MTSEVSATLGPQRRVRMIDGPRIIDITAAVALLHEHNRSPEAAARLARAETPPNLKLLLADSRQTLELVSEATSAALAANATATSTGCQILYSLSSFRCVRSYYGGDYSSRWWHTNSRTETSRKSNIVVVE